MVNDLKGECHCGQVKWTYHGKLEKVLACNCTACRRYGTLWAHGRKDEEISVSGETLSYSYGDKSLAFHFCPNCGNLAYWMGLREREDGYRAAVNTRLAVDPSQIQNLTVRHFDGFDKFQHDPEDHRTVKDMWY